MIVPEYWAEAKERVVIDGKARTYKRFGWSDVSEREALENARDRVSEAAQLARRGEKVRLVDRKVAYNGSEGVPIREEIIGRHGDSVITRNGYGAACLNTPDVLFADVDVKRDSYVVHGWSVFAGFLVAAFGAYVVFDRWFVFLGVAAVGLVVSPGLGYVLSRTTAKYRPSPFDEALVRIESFGRENASWLLRIYRTPNGFRVLAMHKTFDPNGDTVQHFMRSIDGDPLYARMCRNQNCFRARVSPKPWRIGIQERMRPRPGVWPIAREKRSIRRRWVQRYEAEAARYASCRYVKTIGSGRSASKCDAVRELHDELCRADSGLPIA